MLLLQALVLAVVHAVATFLPLSASGHREGVRYLSGWEAPGPGFELAVHLGTLVAAVWFFRGDLAYLATRLVGRGPATEQSHARRSAGLLALASLPALLAGIWLQPRLPGLLPREQGLAAALYATALLLAGGEWLRRRRLAGALGVATRELTREQRRRDHGRDEATATSGDAVGIGLVQAVALLPGLSRTAATVAAGMALGLSRAAAARLALLLSVPVLAGATLASALAVGGAEAALPLAGWHLAVAAVAAALTGYWAIGQLLRVAAGEDLLGFARWVALFATLLLLASWLVIG